MPKAWLLGKAAQQTLSAVEHVDAGTEIPPGFSGTGFDSHEMNTLCRSYHTLVLLTAACGLPVLTKVFFNRTKEQIVSNPIGT